MLDRFSASTIAYQGYGRGLDIDKVIEMDRWARGGLEPDLTIWLDCPVRVGLERAARSDRFHEEREAFHEKVRGGFAALAAASGSPWRRIDATLPEDDVRVAVRDAIDELLERR